MLRLRSLVLVAALAALCLLVLPGTSFAGSIAVTSSGSLTFFAQVGEQNDLGVTQGASTYTVHDAGASITPGAGCSTVDANTVSCQAAGVTMVFLSLIDGDDRAVLDISALGPSLTSPCSTSTSRRRTSAATARTT